MKEERVETLSVVEVPWTCKQGSEMAETILQQKKTKYANLSFFRAPMFQLFQKKAKSGVIKDQSDSNAIHQD